MNKVNNTLYKRYITSVSVRMTYSLPELVEWIIQTDYSQWQLQMKWSPQNKHLTKWLVIHQAATTYKLSVLWVMLSYVPYVPAITWWPKKEANSGGNPSTEIPIYLKSIDKSHMVRLMCHIPFHRGQILFHLCALANPMFKVTNPSPSHSSKNN